MYVNFNICCMVIDVWYVKICTCYISIHLSYTKIFIFVVLYSIIFVIYIDFYLAAVIISMEMFSTQCQEKKENKKRKHRILHDEFPALFAHYVLYYDSQYSNTKNRRITSSSPSVQTRVRKTRLFIVTKVDSPLLSLLDFMNKHRHFVEWFHRLFLCPDFDDTALWSEKYNWNFEDLTAIKASNILKMTG